MFTIDSEPNGETIQASGFCRPGVFFPTSDLSEDEALRNVYLGKRLPVQSQVFTKEEREKIYTKTHDVVF